MLSVSAAGARVGCGEAGRHGTATQKEKGYRRGGQGDEPARTRREEQCQSRASSNGQRRAERVQQQVKRAKTRRRPGKPLSLLRRERVCLHRPRRTIETQITQKVDLRGSLGRGASRGERRRWLLLVLGREGGTYEGRGKGTPACCLSSDVPEVRVELPGRGECRREGSWSVSEGLERRKAGWAEKVAGQPVEVHEPLRPSLRFCIGRPQPDPTDRPRAAPSDDDDPLDTTAFFSSQPLQQPRHVELGLVRPPAACVLSEVDRKADVGRLGACLRESSIMKCVVAPALPPTNSGPPHASPTAVT